jgi:hypothetical protein
MFSSKVIGAALAAACLTAIGTMPAAHAQQPMQVITNGPQVNPGDMGGWSARQNRIESRRYDRLVATNPRFASFRERKECGPITLPSLRAQCIQSFRTYEGASVPPMGYRYRSYFGR